MNLREAIENIADMIQEQMPKSVVDRDHAIILAGKIIEIGTDLLLGKVLGKVAKQADRDHATEEKPDTKCYGKRKP